MTPTPGKGAGSSTLPFTLTHPHLDKVQALAYAVVTGGVVTADTDDSNHEPERPPGCAHP